jgi:zinc transport system permease protein
MSLEILTFSFMHRALISGVAIAILCSVIGLFLVLRRYSLFGDAIAHSSFGGIALGLMAGIYPLWTAYGVSLVSALIITKIKEKYDISGDASIAVLLSSGIAIGLVIVGISGGFTIDIFSFLFGSILLVSVNETILILFLTGIILIVVLLLYRQLLYSTFNEEQAKVSGIPVEKINYLIVFMAGLTVVTSIQLVGVLLISALFVITNVTAIMYGKGFKQTAILSISFSIFSVVTGILISYIFDITPAGTIVLLSIGLFAGTMGLKSSGLLSAKN